MLMTPAGTDQPSHDMSDKTGSDNRVVLLSMIMLDVDPNGLPAALPPFARWYHAWVKDRETCHPGQVSWYGRTNTDASILSRVVQSSDHERSNEVGDALT